MVLWLNGYMKNIIIGVVLVALVVVVYIFVVAPKEQTVVVADHKNIAYELDGQRITLKNGTADFVAGDDSAPRSTVTYFGNEATGDFNGDGINDIAFLLAQDNGGSGTFFYIVAAIKADAGYTGTNGIFLGDRIAPQTTEFREGQIIVNYATRKIDEPMTARPSVGVSKYLKIEGNRLVETSGN